MATFTTAPDFASPVEIKPLVLRAAFGDGYVQRTGRGINRMGETWQLTFGGRTPTEAATVADFLAARAGAEPFDWTSPTGTTGRWVCEEWSWAQDNEPTRVINATFTQDFAP